MGFLFVHLFLVLGISQNDPEFHSRSQLYEKAKSSVVIFLQSP